MLDEGVRARQSSARVISPEPTPGHQLASDKSTGGQTNASAWILD